jgi:pimeloyl-ACP methyl ester carboxylesterase
VTGAAAAVAGPEQPAAERVLRTELVDVGGGRAACVLDWGGGGDVIICVHPNGFCAGLFDPVARALPLTFRPVAIDLLGHGRSYQPSPDEPVSFESIAADVAAALDQLGITRGFLVGCSLGGGVAILLDRLRPGLASGILLCEAGAFPAGSRPEHNPMADRLRRRRRVWPDQASMRAAWRGRGAMSDLGRAADAGRAGQPAVRPRIRGEDRRPVTRTGRSRGSLGSPAPAQYQAGHDRGLRSVVPADRARCRAGRAARLPDVPVARRPPGLLRRRGAGERDDPALLLLSSTSSVP